MILRAGLTFFVLVSGASSFGRNTYLPAPRPSAPMESFVSHSRILDKPDSRESGKTNAPVMITSATAQRGNTVNDVEIKATVSELVNSCIGGCELPRIIESMVHNQGQLRGLEAREVENAHMITTRAAALVKMGFSSEVASHIAARELGINPKAVEKDCP